VAGVFFAGLATYDLLVIPFEYYVYGLVPGLQVRLAVVGVGAVFASYSFWAFNRVYHGKWKHEWGLW
jgi:hypothetical protein